MTTRISDYGLIGNSRTAALVSKHGSIDWCCLPRFDSASVFAAILDGERGGRFEIRPLTHCNSKQRYLEDTNILETTFEMQRESVRLLDCFFATSEADKRDRLFPDQEILRIVEGLCGDCRMLMTFAPRPGFGTQAPAVKRFGSWGMTFRYSNEVMILQTGLGIEDASWDEENQILTLEFTIREGQSLPFSLIHSREGPAVIPPLGQEALDRFKETAKYWRDWIGLCRYDGPYQKQVRRSALILKLLTFAPSGAIIAAPTTSLPEAIGGPRNWDYRYCWLRDASFTVRSLVALGFYEEAKAHVSWLLHTTRLTRPQLQVVYSVYGESKLPERIIHWFSGYRDSRPVRVGNAAAHQLQMDIYGEVVDSVFHVLPHLEGFDKDTHDLLHGLGKTVQACWNAPDEGIWEVRSGRFHHTHSKVMCWVALDRLAKICSTMGWKGQESYRRTANEIREAIETRGFNSELGFYTRHFGGEEVDASLLVMPLVGYCDADSPRMRATVQAIEDRLGSNHFLYRYLPGGDGLEGEEGAFGICNFWMAATLFKMGRFEEGDRWMESFVDDSRLVSLWPEEIDPQTGSYLGNYPQAFTHVGLINAAITRGAA